MVRTVVGIVVSLEGEEEEGDDADADADEVSDWSGLELEEKERFGLLELTVSQIGWK